MGHQKISTVIKAEKQELLLAGNFMIWRPELSIC